MFQHGSQFVGGGLERLRFSSSSRASSLDFGTARTCLRNSSNLARGSRFGFGLLLPKGSLPDQLTVGNPLTDDSRRGRHKPRGVGRFAGVEAIGRLVQVAVKVLWFDRVMRPVDHPLEQRPE